MDKSFEILEKLEAEANYLFDSGKISAAQYSVKIFQVNHLKKTLYNCEIYTNADKYQHHLAIIELLEKLEFLNNYIALFGGCMPILEKSRVTVNELAEILQEAQKPLKTIDLLTAIYTKRIIKSIDKGTQEAKEILIQQYGPQKAAEMWEKAEQLNKQA